MGTYTIDQYQKVWRTKAKMIRKAGIKSSRDAASFMTASAKGMAPVKTGNLRKKIKFKHIKDSKYQVTSSVKTDFPYNLWVNQTAPYRTIALIFNGGSPTVYGDGSHRITGTPRFFHFATLRTKVMFAKLARKNIQKVLRVTVI